MDITHKLTDENLQTIVTALEARGYRRLEDESDIDFATRWNLDNINSFIRGYDVEVTIQNMQSDKEIVAVNEGEV